MDDSTRRQLRHLLRRLHDRLEVPDNASDGLVELGPVEASAWQQELADAIDWLDETGAGTSAGAGHRGAQPPY